MRRRLCVALTLTACGLVLLLLDPLVDAQQSFRAGTHTVAVYATVTDASGALVPDLRERDFQVLDSGKPQAITATAHKLARIIFHLLSTREPYKESVFRQCEEETLRRAELRLRKHAAQLGFQIVPSVNT